MITISLGSSKMISIMCREGVRNFPWVRGGRTLLKIFNKNGEKFYPLSGKKNWGGGGRRLGNLNQNLVIQNRYP